MAKGTTKAAPANNREAGSDFEEDAALPSEFGGEELVKVQTGFPPYLKIEEGQVFFCKVKMLDISDPAFTRFVCENLGDSLTCAVGKVDSAEEMEVSKGGEFSLSWYATLPLEWAMGPGAPLKITVLEQESNGKLADGSPRKLWRFSYETTAKYKALIETEKSRALSFGPRYITEGEGKKAERKPNPVYLQAFMGGAALPPAQGPRSANAEA
jgi:hypothetical protein